MKKGTFSVGCGNTAPGREKWEKDERKSLNRSTDRTKVERWRTERGRDTCGDEGERSATTDGRE